MNEVLPCAVYTRKSSEDGLEQGFNSLDAQREACEAYILSQKAQGWKPLKSTYDDGGFSGGNTDRPALKLLLADIAAKRIRIVVVYKVDRLTRSLADFAKLVELFDAHGVSFVSVTQQFNTTTSMGRLTLNVLLSFAQFEREVTGERIRDKIAASKKKGMWMGGNTPVGYLPHERTLVIDEPQAGRIREIYRLYLEIGCVRRLKAEIDRRGWETPQRTSRRENASGGRPFSRGHLYRLLSNPIYRGQIAHKGVLYEGQHPAIIDADLWQMVQERLKANLQGHQTRLTAADPTLLTGLVVNDQGQRLTPTHATKGSKRYRYYVCPSLHTAGRGAVPDAVRWPAQELEEVVIRALVRLLMDGSRIITLMGTADAGEVRRRLRCAEGLAKQLPAANSADKIEILNRIVTRVTVHTEKINIEVRTAAAWSSSDMAATEASPTVIDIPVELKRSGMGLRLVVRVPGESATPGPDRTLVALIAKAHDWFARLTSGRCENVQVIADEEQVTSSYVTRVIYIAFMDPHIIRRIMRGDHPTELNATRLMKKLPLPLAWEEQRLLLGMAS